MSRVPMLPMQCTCNTAAALRRAVQRSCAVYRAVHMHEGGRCKALIRSAAPSRCPSLSPCTAAAHTWPHLKTPAGRATTAPAAERGRETQAAERRVEARSIMSTVKEGGTRKEGREPRDGFGRPRCARGLTVGEAAWKAVCIALESGGGAPKYSAALRSGLRSERLRWGNGQGIHRSRLATQGGVCVGPRVCGERGGANEWLVSERPRKGRTRPATQLC